MEQLHFEVDLAKRAELGNPPAWSPHIERWYQLDELGFAFCEAIHAWDYLKNYPKPDLIILAIRGGSNLADYDFVSTGSSSPAKFVYTLPNISAAILFQMLKIQGKVFCLSEGDKTFEVAEQEAQNFSKSGKCVWLFGSRSENERTRKVIFRAW